ncbi:hypothetical protein ACPA9J_35345 [Pseudomonas aeruginosa]
MHLLRRSHHLRRRAELSDFSKRRCTERRPRRLQPEGAEPLRPVRHHLAAALAAVGRRGAAEHPLPDGQGRRHGALPGNLRRRRHRRLRARGRRGAEGTGQLRRPAPTVDAGIGPEETLTLTLPSAQGFTAIGRMAAPGKRLSIRIEDAGQASLAVGLNTQRIGSTRLVEYPPV